MKPCKILIAAATAVFIAAAGSQAQYIADIQSYAVGYTLEGNTGANDLWTTNDGNSNNIVTLTYLDTSNWAGIGGGDVGSPATRNPTTIPADIFTNFSLGDGANALFETTMQITNSLPSYPNRDEFGWKFRTSTLDGQTPIVSIDFKPITYLGFPADQLYYTDWQGNQFNTGFGMYANAKYDLAVTVTDLGGVAPSIHIKLTSYDAIPTVGEITAALPIGTPTGIGQIAASWKPTTPGSAGSNGLYFETYAVAVPEPSVIALLGLAGLGLVYWRTKRAKAA